MKLTPKAAALYLLGILLATVPVGAATLSYFPLWLARGGKVAVSGLCLCLLLLSALPLYRALKGALRTPSVTTLWGLVFLLFFALRHIADEITVIALTGFLSNLLAALLFRIARRVGR